MPTMSTSAPLMKMAMVNAQKAGLKIRPICSFVIRKALLIGPATSPRIAKTIAVVTSETQLATKSLCLCMKEAPCGADHTERPERSQLGRGISQGKPRGRLELSPSHADASVTGPSGLSLPADACVDARRFGR